MLDCTGTTSTDPTACGRFKYCCRISCRFAFFGCSWHDAYDVSANVQKLHHTSKFLSSMWRARKAPCILYDRWMISEHPYLPHCPVCAQNPERTLDANRWKKGDHLRKVFSKAD